ncbi:hypothetical protein DMA11_19450 [Marinilabiliaceae bacterium JC017]|nr:hypothetical protein DMA11_19450 [Marinilabiliaceae bacterium JC017]
MKIRNFIGAAAFAACMLTSCASVQTPLMGLAYTDVKAPLAVTSNTGSSKVGTATAKGILGLVATGDASVEAAAKSAGITKIHNVDYHSTSVLGIVSEYSVVVYGE